MTDIFDAVVVGSGATGSWAARELAEQGLRVAVLEAGPGFEGELAAATDEERRDLVRRRPIQSKCPAFQPATAHLYVDDLENPYSVEEGTEFDWIRGRQLGGRMRVWGRVCPRFSETEFSAGRSDGAGGSWPISYADLEPYYGPVERALGVTGLAENVAGIPDGEFLPPPPLTPGEKAFRAAVLSRWPGRRVTVCRQASRGIETVLDAARATGRATIVTDAVASHLLIDSREPRAKGVAYVDRGSRAAREILGRDVILCASTLESTRLLLNSSSAQFPEAPGNSSGLLGRYLFDHTFGISLEGYAPAAIAPETDGVGESNGCYIPAFRNVTEPRGDFRGSYGIELGVPRAAPGERSSFWMFAFGEMLPRPENRVTLDPSQKDEWGIPALRVACRHSKNELRMACDEFQVLRELAGAAGFEIVRENARLCPPGSAIHEMGTARMGTDPKTSVLDPFNRCWDVKNVVVADGACFPSGGFQNPTLTMMALAVRACRALGERLRKGEP